MKNYHGNIEKYYYQLVLVMLKLIIINISVCNIMNNIPGLNTNFLLLQAYKKNISVIYLI